MCLSDDDTSIGADILTDEITSLASNTKLLDIKFDVD